MEMLAALEEMVQSNNTIPDTYCDLNAERWMKLFNFSREQAENAIDSHLNNLSRITISDEQWNLLSGSPDALDHDKESYTYHLSRSKLPVVSKRTLQTDTCEYVLKLEHPLNTIERVCDVARLDHTPDTFWDETGTSKFIVVNAVARAALEEYAQPTQLMFALLKKPAQKELSSYSVAPTLGIDTTLPQNRGAANSVPTQDEYPVSYFFYGTLADPEILSRLLGLEEEPAFRSAEVQCGMLKTWGGKYRALVDADEKDVVLGWEFEVTNKQHEDALRSYEGDHYEVVRCGIHVKGKIVKGLTFRFCGDEQLLS